MRNKKILFLLFLIIFLKMAKAQNIPFSERIDPQLRLEIEHFGSSLELDPLILLNNPSEIQKERLDLVKNESVEIPENVRILDLATNSSIDNYEIRLHCYQASEYNPRNVILYFHGGGYVFGLPEQAEKQMITLSQKLKATIISVDYRLSPQFKFPIPIIDGFDALKWIIAEGSEHLGIDPGSITVYGASAGGHLAASVTQMAVDSGIKNIKHQFLLYPVIHNHLNTASMNEFTNTPLWNKNYASIAWRHFLGTENIDKSFRYADLTIFDQIKELPSTTIVACELDPLRDEGISYALQLYQAGVTTELWVIPGALHVFDLFHSELTDEFNRFLNERLNKGFQATL